jgi:S-DNA-T family DNA segregation ATPase FtsK/SpoIIIE
VGNARSPRGAARRLGLQEKGLPIGDALEERLLEAGSLLFALLAILTVLGLLGWTQGKWIDVWASGITRWLGWGAWTVPVLLGYTAFLFWAAADGALPEIPWRQIIALEVLLLGLLSILSLAFGFSLANAESGQGGGLIGWGIGRLVSDLMGPWLGGLLLLALVVLPGWYLVRSVRHARHRIASDQASAAFAAAQRVLVEPDPVKPQVSDSPGKRPPAVPAAFRKEFKIPSESHVKTGKVPRRDRHLPGLAMLEMGEPPRVTAREVNRTAGLIEKTLADFGLPVRVVDFRAGPAVTQFAVEPGFLESTAPDGEGKRQKVRVSQISALASDLALALSAPTVRIEAPVPGQAYVGIEVPNQRAAMVRLGPLMGSEGFARLGSPLTVALGRDVAGSPVLADLASMPHLLIAGTTGSGKSVCITALTVCLVMNNAPEDLNLVMIDPKMVELVRFNGLPHLIGRVETDLERITAVLRWCTAEMDRRYKQLENAKARDIMAYNAKMRRRGESESMPRIVVLVDELADLMMMAPDQTERTLVRLAQMARAVGIHLVVATQRPSTDIVTGLIKANFPARISFAVASGVDSRVILDSQGAESLLGRGDMLYLSPEAAAPVRLQGAFVSDGEIEAVVSAWQQLQPAPEVSAPVAPPWEGMIGRGLVEADDDDTLQRAIEVVQQTGQASASMLQRRLRIGYPRAARLMDELEEMGIVGRVQGGGRTREVLQPEQPEDDEIDE